MKNGILPALAAVAMLPACTTTGNMRETVTLIAPEAGPTLLGQCSRTAPTDADNFFTPSTAEITAIETDTAAVLRANSLAYARYATGNLSAFDWPVDPSLYNRQYVGYVADGRRMIYGNFVPASFAPSSTQPIIICDGGPSLFGVEYDIERGQVERIAFNGGLSGPALDPIEP